MFSTRHSPPSCPVLPNTTCFAYGVEYHCLYEKLKILTYNKYLVTVSFKNCTEPACCYLIQHSCKSTGSSSPPVCGGHRGGTSRPWRSRFRTSQPLEWDLYKKAFVQDVCLRFSALPSCLVKANICLNGHLLAFPAQLLCSSSHSLSSRLVSYCPLSLPPPRQVSF